MPKHLPPLELSNDERHELERVSRSRKAAVRRGERAATLLALADGEAVTTIAERQGGSQATIYNRRARFMQRRFDSLDDEPRSGRPAT